MKFIARFTTLFAFLTLTTFAWAEPAVTATTTAHPPVWQVEGKGAGKAVLLGSLHLLPQGVAWESDKLRAMAKNADVYVFEVPTDTATLQKMQLLVRDHGTQPKGQTLHSVVPDKDHAQLDHVLKELHWTAAQVDGYRPWLVAYLMDIAQMKKAHQTTPGPDFVFGADARASGKPVEYLETLEEQFALIAPDNMADELEYFEDTIDGFDTADTEREKLTNAWIDGDADTLAKVIDDGFKGYPRDKARFFTARNARWVKKITAMLQTGKSYFIVVGAGHLCGPEGVPAMLEKEGYLVTRK